MVGLIGVKLVASRTPDSRFLIADLDNDRPEEYISHARDN